MSQPKRLVIDASIARSAGETEHPISKRCRDFLNTVLAMKYRLVYTEAIKAEWRRHQSGLARKWLTQMFARKLVVQVELADYQAVWDRVGRVIKQAEILQAMEKDWLLIEAALETDNCISSLDDRVRGHYRQAAQQVGELRLIVWVNPTRLEETPLEWLRDGAASQHERQLGYGV